MRAASRGAIAVITPATTAGVAAILAAAVRVDHGILDRRQILAAAVIREAAEAAVIDYRHRRKVGRACWVGIIGMVVSFLIYAFGWIGVGMAVFGTLLYFALEWGI